MAFFPALWQDERQNPQQQRAVTRLQRQIDRLLSLSTLPEFFFFRQLPVKKEKAA